MIRLLSKLDKKQHYWVAVSGGVDSMAAYHFLKQMKYWVQPLFFNHGTETSDDAQRFLLRHPLMDTLQTSGDAPMPPKPKGISQEEHWRNQRYKFFKVVNRPVITAHHLDDVIETWLFSSIHGQSKLMPYSHGPVIRPFLNTPKSDLIAWAESHGVTWIEDSTNMDPAYARNRIRHQIVPEALLINPGMHKMLRKKLLTRGAE